MLSATTGLPSKKIIVFEEYLKEILKIKHKVVVIPHAVEQKQVLDKNESKQKLGLDLNQKYILYFGYISPYKGIDKFIENYPKDTDYKLIVAGGINPNHSSNSEQITGINKLPERVTRHQSFIFFFTELMQEVKR